MWIEPLKFLTEQYPATYVYIQYNCTEITAEVNGLEASGYIWSVVKNKRTGNKQKTALEEGRNLLQVEKGTETTACSTQHSPGMQYSRSADKCKQYSGITIKDNKRSEF